MITAFRNVSTLNEKVKLIALKHSNNNYNIQIHTCFTWFKFILHAALAFKLILLLKSFSKLSKEIGNIQTLARQEV